MSFSLLMLRSFFMRLLRMDLPMVKGCVGEAREVGGGGAVVGGEGRETAAAATASERVAGGGQHTALHCTALHSNAHCTQLISHVALPVRALLCECDGECSVHRASRRRPRAAHLPRRWLLRSSLVCGAIAHACRAATPPRIV